MFRRSSPTMRLNAEPRGHHQCWQYRYIAAFHPPFSINIRISALSSGPEDVHGRKDSLSLPDSGNARPGRNGCCVQGLGSASEPLRSAESPPADRVNDPERRRRFIQEARAASALNHPNIVAVYDVDRADGTDFIAMEYVARQASRPNDRQQRPAIEGGIALRHSDRRRARAMRTPLGSCTVI